MTIRLITAVFLSLGLFLSGCKHSDNVKPVTPGILQVSSVKLGSTNLSLTGSSVTSDLPIDQPVSVAFSSPVDVTTVPMSVTLKQGSDVVDTDISYLANNSIVVLTPKQSLSNNTSYSISVSNQLTGANKETFGGLSVPFKTITASFTITSLSIGGQVVTGGGKILNVPLDANIVVNFSQPLKPESVTSSSVYLSGPNFLPLTYTFSNGNKTLTLTRSQPLTYLSSYELHISNEIKGANDEVYAGSSRTFVTEIGDHTSGFPTLTDDQLLDKVQSQTLKYFYDFGHPVSGLARERDTSGDIVTTGGSGFGLMALVAGIERGFIPRADGMARFSKIVKFLEKADRFHGAWPHWMDGATGKVVPFSPNDNGADLVETSFMAQGLITVRQYLQPSDTVGNNLINRINGLWTTIEWDWFRQETQKNVLYWHWSPDKAWVMNFALSGYFEEQITYFMAAASPTHTIPKIVYSNGFGQNGAIKTNKSFTYNGETYVLPLDGLAPLFWVQYSYLGMNPHFSDDYADYWTQNVNATLINHAYCAENPKNYIGYSDSCWGLTASDNPSGYNAQSPANDNGTITPTAALSSFPYAPEQSMKALKFFYYKVGDRLWGDYGFYDAFNFSQGWVASSTLAIDQGPIVVMIENYRSGLLWNLFESAPEVQAARTKLGFH